MKARHVVASVLLVAFGFGAGAFWSPRRAPASPEPHVVNAVRYHCPMHPNYTSDSPGTCPICGMTLVPIGGGPQVPPGGAAGTTGIVDPDTLPPGTIYISPEKQQLVGVTYAVAESTREGQGFRAVGNVSVDETRVVKVHPRFEGWIDKVFADYTGKLVSAGAPLLTVYSPDLLAGQQEYLLALRNRERFASAAGGAGASGDSLVAASRQRLRLWDLTDAQLDEVARTGEPITNVTLSAPVSGYVVARNAYPKQHVMPDAELFTIADLSRVWVMADVAEQDAPLVRVGMPVTVSAAAGRTFTGRVDVIQPQIDPTSRTLKARIDAANPGLALRPDMFVDLEFTLPGRERLTVPAAAVVASGLRRVVFVDRGSGHLEPRAVETGALVGDRVEIVRGLARGERIVASGTFLIDSESQLKAAITGMGAGGPAPLTGAPASAPAAPSAPAGPGHVHD